MHSVVSQDYEMALLTQSTVCVCNVWWSLYCPLTWQNNQVLILTTDLYTVNMPVCLSVDDKRFVIGAKRLYCKYSTKQKWSSPVTAITQQKVNRFGWNLEQWEPVSFDNKRFVLFCIYPFVPFFILTINVKKTADGTPYTLLTATDQKPQKSFLIRQC